jgi:hypothetical protein
MLRVTVCAQCIAYAFYQVLTFPLRVLINVLQFKITFKQVIFGIPPSPTVQPVQPFFV